jgi:hypothetical protein
MKPFILLLFGLFPFHALFAQATHAYRFDGTFSGTGGGPALTETLACGATSGSFFVQSISTSAGLCCIDTAYCFNDGGGIKYVNPSYITNQYTIHLFFKFNTIGGWSRIIDFSNSTADAGIYWLTDCLNFYPNGNVGTCPYFVAGLWYLMSFVRDGSTGIISVYVNGVLFGSYNDSGTNLYRCATSTTPITFFRDDNVVQCEAQPGCVKYLSVSSTVATAAQVATTWATLCTSIVLPVELSTFQVSCVNQSQLITWTTASENNNNYFVVEKSADGVNWQEMEKVLGSGNSNNTREYAASDDRPFENTYYRIKQVDYDGESNYSQVTSKKLCTNEGTVFEVYPNPAHRTIQVVSGFSGKLELCNLLGIKLAEYNLSEGKNTLNLPEGAYGTYLLKSSAHVEKLVIQ